MPGSDAEIDLWETMRTARAIRRFKNAPVDDAIIARCLEAATWAPSGGNQQPWHFMILKSPEARAAVAAGARESLEVITNLYQLVRPAPDDDRPRARNARRVFDFHDMAASAPAAVLFCVKEDPATPSLLVGASIYPAMENFLLAARALGLGTCTTHWQSPAEAQLRAATGIPAQWQLAALVMVGWPEGRHGPLRRRPVSDVASRDRWEQPLEL